MEKIIKLNKKYLDQLAEVDFSCEHPNDTQRKLTKVKMKKYISERFDKKQEIFFGYKINSEIVGYATLKLFFPGYKHCELYWLAVKKKFQKQGIGKKLMEFVESFAKKKGFRKVCLYTDEDMIGAQKFYKKCGYKLINKFPNYYGFGKGFNNTAVMMYKEI
ncbi:MAG: GNAT family N-acetyltransferase [Candidatus Woesearchaeota archaeon]